MPFTFQKLSIPDVVLVEPKIFPDERGCFIESFKASDFAKAGLPANFVQDNFSFSQKGVVRGLHYQKKPKAQGKLISVIKGSIWDVAVDIRQQSPTFRRWVAVELNDVNKWLLYVPPGFAHGFAALSDADVLYKCTEEYCQSLEAGVFWSDPDIGINWCIQNPVMSAHDACLPLLRNIIDLF